MNISVSLISMLPFRMWYYWFIEILLIEMSPNTTLNFINYIKPLKLVGFLSCLDSFYSERCRQLIGTAFEKISLISLQPKFLHCLFVFDACGISLKSRVSTVGARWTVPIPFLLTISILCLYRAVLESIPGSKKVPSVFFWSVKFHNCDSKLWNSREHYVCIYKEVRT